jgi:hypothetical protein
MNKISILLISLFLIGCNSSTTEKPHIQRKVTPPVLNQFQAVWGEVISDPLTTLPQESVSYFKLFNGSVDLISKDAERTLHNREDIIEPFDKLAHPNGVCLKGLWEIDTPNPYSGEFKRGSKALIIARASSAMSNTKRGEIRAFGMAGKLFASTNPLKLQTKPSANFFVIDDLGGTDAPYYTDVALTNEPSVSFTRTVFGSLVYALKVASAFSSADKNSGIRQLYELSYLGEEENTTIITPKWMKIEAEKNQTKFGVDDFREEFKLEKGETLRFNISVASKEEDGVKKWHKIGKITFDSSVISTTCDHRLHFHHPLWRDDLVYE